MSYGLLVGWLVGPCFISWPKRQSHFDKSKTSFTVTNQHHAMCSAQEPSSSIEGLMFHLEVKRQCVSGIKHFRILIHRQ